LFPAFLRLLDLGFNALNFPLTIRRRISRWLRRSGRAGRGSYGFVFFIEASARISLDALAGRFTVLSLRLRRRDACRGRVGLKGLI